MTKLEQLVKEFWEIVDKIECSDNGHYFFPTKLNFSSCRTMDGIRLDKIITEMKQIVGVPPRMTEEELHLKNHPDNCKNCFGEGRSQEGYVCPKCHGSGSSDPTVCPRCKGTGDLYNHERESNDCPICKTTGRVKKCTAPDCEDGTIKLVKTSDWRDCTVCEGIGLVPDDDSENW